MKKRFLSAAIAAAMLISSVPAVSAEETAVDVLLNGDFVEFADQAPANIDGRVLVPVRAVVEKMGATVDWNEQTKQVEVKKGDVDIVLTVNEPSISVNGTKKELDTAPQVINGRTMLPIRAVAEELGATVGWDSDENSVIIVDWNSYIKEIQTDAPSFYSFLNQKNIVYNNYLSTGNGSVNFDFSAKLPEYAEDGTVTKTEENSVKLSVNVASADKFKSDALDSNITLKFDLADVQEVLKKFTGAEVNYDLSKLDTVDINVVADKTAVYVKTNLVQKLADAFDDSKIDALAALMNTDSWFKLKFDDIAKISEKFGADDTVAKVFEKCIDYSVNQKNADVKILDFILDLAKSFNYDMTNALFVDNVVNTYTTVYGDKYFNYEKTGENAYKLSVKIDKDAYRDMLAAQYKELGIETSSVVDEVLDKMNIVLNMDIVCDEKGNIVSSAKMEYSMNVEDGDDTYIKVGLNMDMNSETKVDAVSEDIKLPDSAVDVMNLIESANIQ